MNFGRSRRKQFAQVARQMDEAKKRKEKKMEANRKDFFFLIMHASRGLPLGSSVPVQCYAKGWHVPGNRTCICTGFG